jgi:hypothetical protein
MNKVVGGMLAAVAMVGVCVADDMVNLSVGKLEAGTLTVRSTLTLTEGVLTDSTVVSADIKNDSIVDADVNSAAAIAISKLATSGNLAAATLTNALGNLRVTNTIVDVNNATNVIVVQGGTIRSWTITTP